MKYIYYRAYCFYKKKGLAFEPHTWATVIPTFISAFILYLTYYIAAIQKMVPKVQGTFVFYAVALFGLNFIMDKMFKDSFVHYKKKWDKEAGPIRLIKGILIAALAIGSFFGVFIIANELHKLKH